MTRRATGWIGWWLALIVVAVAQEPAPTENANEPTPEQAAQLQERDELAARAQSLLGEGKLPQAIEVAQQVLAIEREIFGEEHAEIATTYGWIGGMQEAADDFSAAEKSRQAALDLLTKLHGTGDWHVTDARMALEQVRLSAGLDQSERKELRRSYALNYRVFELWSLGKSREALPFAEEALAIRRRLCGDNHPITAGSLLNLAAQHEANGDYARAEPLCREALEIRRHVLGDEHPDYATSLNNLAGLYESTGDYGRAEPLYRQALAIQKKVLGDEHPNYAGSLNNLALLYDAMGDYDRAEPLYRQAMEIWKKALGEQHPNYATSLNNLAVLYRSVGNYARSEPLYRRAMAIRKKALGEGSPAYATSLNNLAMLYRAMGEDARAEPLYRQALEIQRKALGKEHPGYAASLNNLASLYVSLGDQAQAEPLYCEALEIWKKVLGEEHPDYASTLNNLAALYYSTGDYTSSIAGLRDAAATYEAARLRVAERSLDRAAFGAVRSPYGLLSAAEAGHGDPIEAWCALEADLARGLLDESASRAGWQLTADEEQERGDLIAALDGLQPRILRLVIQTDPEDETKAELAELLELRSAAEARLARLAAVLSQRQVADLKDVQASLPADGAFVTWVDVSSANEVVHEHWGCVVRADRPPDWVRLPGLGVDGVWTEDDAKLPKRLREALAEAAAPEEVEEFSRQLAAQRIAPLLPHLDGVERLYVAAVNEMAGVPVDVLTDQFIVSYTPSGTQLVRLRERKRPSGQATLLALGDPVFSQPGDDAIESPAPTNVATGEYSIAQLTRGKRWDELPGTRIEIAGLAKLFPAERVMLLADGDASEQRLAALRDSGELAQFHYLHLATHGQVNQASAFESALILAQDDLSTVDDVAAGVAFFDGRLTANEILEHWTLNAELVTLSSCGSGLGRAGGGEGFLGFAQALLLAGSRSVCLTVWEVDDTATALLMDRFYQNLLGRREGLESPLNKAESLAEAKEWLRSLTGSQATDFAVNLSQRIARGAGHKTHVVDLVPPTASDADAHPYEHPYFWAAFVLIGDPE